MTCDNSALKTPEEMAEILNVKLHVIYRLSHQGKIPKLRIGRLLRFDPVEVLQCFKNPGTKPQAMELKTVENGSLKIEEEMRRRAGLLTEGD